MRTSKAHQARRRGDHRAPLRPGTCGPFRCPVAFWSPGPGVSPPSRRGSAFRVEIRSRGGPKESPGDPRPSPLAYRPAGPPRATYRDAGRSYLGGRGDAPFPRTCVPSARQHQLSFQHKHPGSSWGATLPQLRPSPAEVTQGSPGLLADRGGAPPPP